MLKGKHILLGVAGGIACYKTAALASALVKQHAAVQVLMTENATRFITPFTFEQLTGNQVLTDLFSPHNQSCIAHIAAAEQADFALIAPATANILAKLANGIADDILTTTLLACDCPKAAAPSMNTKMYENPVTQDNLSKLRKYGWEIIEPLTGRLACGTIGTGKMPEPEQLLEVCLHGAAHTKDMVGKHVLVTAGPTCEAIDPVRYITNHSSGKMGYAIAKAAVQRGAAVTMVSGKTELSKPMYLRTIDALSAEDMHREVLRAAEDADIIIMAAAVADYRPIDVATQKMKKSDDDLTLHLFRTEDILAELGKRKKRGQFLCGFSMETEHLIENSRRKLVRKNLDLIAANQLNQKDCGFRTDTNQFTLIREQEIKTLPLMSKEAAAHALLDEILRQQENATSAISESS